MGATAMARFRSIGDLNYAASERALTEDKPKAGAVLADFQKKREAARARVARIPNPLPPQRRRMTLAEERAQADIMSVALKQSHRINEKDPSDPWLGTPLGRFCLKGWPGEKDAERRHVYHHAGNIYGKACYVVRLARGFRVEGVDSERVGASGDYDHSLEEIAEMQASRQALEDQLRLANWELLAVSPKLPRAMEALCCTIYDPSPYSEGILAAGLYRLAVHYEIADALSR